MPAEIPDRPRVRAGLTIASRGTDLLVFSSRPDSFRAIDDPGGSWYALLDACDGSRDARQLRGALARLGHELDADELAAALRALQDEGLIVDGAADVTDEWENQRAYFEMLAAGGRLTPEEMLRRVHATRALLLGAGGAGTWLALALAASGIGSLTVVDPDRVERRNLTRQPYRTSDVGRRKVEALGEMIADRRPELRFAGVAARIDDEADLIALLADIDVVVACADEPSADHVGATVARACVSASIPHLTAAYVGPVARIGPTWMPSRRALPCYGCLMLAREREHAAYGPTAAELARVPRRAAAVTVAQAQIVSALVVAELLHLRAGIRPATAGRVCVFDLLRLQSWRSRLRRHPDCEMCATPTTRGALAYARGSRGVEGGGE